MYKLILEKTGELIGMTEHPDWIKQNENGTYIPTSRDDAQGIAYNSVAYNLLWGKMPDLETVLIHEEDTGRLFEKLMANQQYIAIMSDITLN